MGDLGLLWFFEVGHIRFFGDGGQGFRPYGGLVVRSKAKARRPDSGSWDSIKGGSWLACDGINPVYLMDRGVCIAGKPAPTEKQSSAVLAVCTRSTCGSGLAREGGGSVNSCVADTPHSRASPLPHLDLCVSDRSVLLCFYFYHSGRLLGRRALLLILLLI